MKISLAMIVKNEESYIERCLESVKGLVDEIVIVDTGSTDNTISLIKQFLDVNLLHFNWCDDFSAARNYSIEHATGDYILVLDADEYIVSGTRYELENVMYKNYIGRILVDSRFQKGNQEHRTKAYVSRFFPKDIRYTGIIHEQLVSDKSRVKLDLKVKHDGYFGTNKNERNIPLLLEEVKRNPLDSYYLFQLGKELRISGRYKESFQFLKKAYEITNKAVPYYGEMVVELINSGKECDEVAVFEIITENEITLENLSDFHFSKGLFYLDYCIKHPHQVGSYMQKIESSFLECLSGNLSIEYLQGTSSFLAAYNLGVYYEVTSELKKALHYYKLSSQYGYLLAKNRLETLVRK